MTAADSRHACLVLLSQLGDGIRWDGGGGVFTDSKDEILTNCSELSIWVISNTGMWPQLVSLPSSQAAQSGPMQAGLSLPTSGSSEGRELLAFARHAGLKRQG